MFIVLQKVDVEFYEVTAIGNPPMSDTSVEYLVGYRGFGSKTSYAIL